LKMKKTMLKLQPLYYERPREKDAVG